LLDANGTDGQSEQDRSGSISVCATKSLTKLSPNPSLHARLVTLCVNSFATVTRCVCLAVGKLFQPIQLLGQAAFQLHRSVVLLIQLFGEAAHL
jgi:hypothetical protein